MKIKKIIFAFLLVVFFAPSVFAQEEENQLFYTFKHEVKPEKIDEYKELMKKFASACKEHNYPFTYSAWQSTHPNFYYFWPAKDHNVAKEVMDKAWGTVIPNMDQDWGSKFFETFESWDDFFLRSRVNLSYNPETNVDGLDYAEWWIHYNKTGTDEKYRNAIKQGVDIHKKTNFEYPISTFRADIGMNNRPAFITIFWGKNPADLYTHVGKGWESFGEEVQKMINDFSSTTRKFEKIPFWRQKELSYSPE
jgi:hypothetical protein